MGIAGGWASHQSLTSSIPMNKPLSLALVAIGVVLLILGASASDSLSSEVSEFFSGSPTDKAIWLLIGGLAALIIGGVGFLRGSRA